MDIFTALNANFSVHTAAGGCQIWQLTPHDGINRIHRFFDTSALSPSGRYVVTTALPTAEGEFPRPGARTGIDVIDLAAGECRRVVETAGWEYQMGRQSELGEIRP